MSDIKKRVTEILGIVRKAFDGAGVIHEEESLSIKERFIFFHERDNVSLTKDDIENQPERFLASMICHELVNLKLEATQDE